MLQIEQAQLNRIIAHKVGNQAREEELVISGTEIELDELTRQILQAYFLNPFKKQETFYQFDTAHPDEPVYSDINRLFSDPSSFQEVSESLAEYLFEITDHPNIKAGEFYLVHFSDLLVEDEVVDAIGLFKSENKDTYLKVFPHRHQPEITAEEGININRLDKGCLIYQTEEDLGYKISIVDQTNKQADAQYWREGFLKVKPREDDFYQTHQYMKMYHDFTKEVFKEQPERPKSEKAEMLNKSVAYFEEKEQFDEQEFVQEVIGEPEVIDAFQAYKEQKQPEQQLPDEGFAISKNAVESSKKKFRSVMKLDKNFHLYIHGSRDYIERGFDETRNLHYYKLFFENEQ